MWTTVCNLCTTSTDFHMESTNSLLGQSQNASHLSANSPHSKSHILLKWFKQSGCCMYSACPNAWGEEGGQVGQEGQYWKQYTLLKESGLLLMGSCTGIHWVVASFNGWRAALTIRQSMTRREHDACLYVLYMLNTSIRCVWDNSCMQTGLYSSNDRITS